MVLHIHKSCLSSYLKPCSLSSHRRWYKDDLCALAFKVLHDKQRGPLVFLRIYSGTLKPQTALHNINRNSTYAVSNLWSPQQLQCNTLSQTYSITESLLQHSMSNLVYLQWEDEQAAGAICWPACRNPFDDSGKYCSYCGTQAGRASLNFQYLLKLRFPPHPQMFLMVSPFI